MVSEIEARIFLTKRFPNLAKTPFEVTSQPDSVYNCIAWAANDNKNLWWPDRFAHWPDGCPRVRTMGAFRKAFETLGYKRSDYSIEFEAFEYIAIFAKADRPEHAARQLADSSWTSKLGPYCDISHSIDGLNGVEYGEPALFMKRPRVTGLR